MHNVFPVTIISLHVSITTRCNRTVTEKKSAKLHCHSWHSWAAKQVTLLCSPFPQTMPQFYSPKHWQNIKFASIYMTIMFSATWVSKDFEGTSSKEKKKKKSQAKLCSPPQLTGGDPSRVSGRTSQSLPGKELPFLFRLIWLPGPKSWEIYWRRWLPVRSERIKKINFPSPGKTRGKLRKSFCSPRSSRIGRRILVTSLSIFFFLPPAFRPPQRNGVRAFYALKRIFLIITM